jgi:hypothetical protein
MIDYRPLWPRRQIVLERLDAIRWSFGKCFDRAIGTVAHVAYHLMPRCRSLRKEAITNPLHVTSN